MGNIGKKTALIQQFLEVFALITCAGGLDKSSDIAYK
jgi:hypothetical protein